MADAEAMEDSPDEVEASVPSLKQLCSSILLPATLDAVADAVGDDVLAAGMLQVRPSLFSSLAHLIGNDSISLRTAIVQGATSAATIYGSQALVDDVRTPQSGVWVGRSFLDNGIQGMLAARAQLVDLARPIANRAPHGGGSHYDLTNTQRSQMNTYVRSLGLSTVDRQRSIQQTGCAASARQGSAGEGEEAAARSRGFDEHSSAL